LLCRAQGERAEWEPQIVTVRAPCESKLEQAEAEQERAPQRGQAIIAPVIVQREEPMGSSLLWRAQG